jgi:hypothetical protein
MATTDTAKTRKSTTRKAAAAKRKPAAKHSSDSRVAQARQLAERAVAIPLDAVLPRIEREVRQARRRVPANVEQLTSRVEKVVQDGAKTGMKLVNGAQDRIARVF